MRDHDTPQPLRLFAKSVLKQAKWRQIDSLVGETAGKRALDLGADNGVISHLLREKGGSWASADLDPTAVVEIRALVESDVHLTDGQSLPFADATFDLVVIIDMLEHMTDDNTLVDEIHRVLRPGGRLIVNVPHVKRFSALRRLRLVLGLTDEWHGHVRPGYTRRELERLLADRFAIRTQRTYNRFFSELLDIALNYAYTRKSGGNEPETAKGTVVTGQDVAKHDKLFRLYSFLYPFMRCFTMLDHLAAPVAGYSLIIAADRVDVAPRAETTPSRATSRALH